MSVLVTKVGGWPRERDDCASSPNSSVAEKGLSDTVDREAFPRKEREHAHRIWTRGVRIQFYNISTPTPSRYAPWKTSVGIGLIYFTYLRSAQTLVSMSVRSWFPSLFYAQWLRLHNNKIEWIDTKTFFFNKNTGITSWIVNVVKPWFMQLLCIDYRSIE